MFCFKGGAGASVAESSHYSRRRLAQLRSRFHSCSVSTCAHALMSCFCLSVCLSLSLHLFSLSLFYLCLSAFSLCLPSFSLFSDHLSVPSVSCLRIFLGAFARYGEGHKLTESWCIYFIFLCYAFVYSFIFRCVRIYCVFSCIVHFAAGFS